MRISDWSSDVCSSDLSGWVIFTSVPPTSTVIEALMRPMIASDGGGLGPRWAHLTGPPPRHPPMAPSLRDIPGANQPRKRFASNRDVFTPSRSPLVDMTPRGMRLERTRRSSFGPSRQLDIGRWVLGLAILAVAVWLGPAFWRDRKS